MHGAQAISGKQVADLPGAAAATSPDGAASTLRADRPARPVRRGLSRIAWLVLLVVLGAALGAGYLRFAPSWNTGPAPPPAKPPVAVSATHADFADIVDRTSFIGSLQATARVAVSAYTAGHVTEVLFDEGQQVAAGTVLLRLDDRVARAELESARARLTLKEAQLRRDTTLRREGFLPQTSLETTDADVAQAKSDVASREADLELLVVRAPFAGTLGEREVALGQYVTPGQTLVDLIDLTRMMVEFRVPENALAAVQSGARLAFETDAYPDRSFTGTVHFVAPQIDPKTRSFLVRAELQVPGRELRPGLFGRVELETGAPRRVLTVPQTALVRELTGSFVYKIDAGRVALTRVETGASHGGGIEILKGLAAGDQIVTAGQFKLQDGDRVTVAPPTDEPAAPAAPKA